MAKKVDIDAVAVIQRFGKYSQTPNTQTHKRAIKRGKENIKQRMCDQQKVYNQLVASTALAGAEAAWDST